MKIIVLFSHLVFLGGHEKLEGGGLLMRQSNQYFCRLVCYTACVFVM